MYYTDSDAERVARYIAGNCTKLLRTLVEEERFDELREFLPDYEELNKNRWTEDKIKIVLQVLASRAPHELAEVLSYLHHSLSGWGVRNYKMYNNCVGYEHHCRENFSIESDYEVTQGTLSDMSEIFLHKDYGPITTVLFGYALMGVFSSVLKRENLRVPYFLQIACSRDSNVYKLIYKILEICDPNYPVGKSCPMITQGHASCVYDIATVYPNESALNTLETLAKIHDLPVIVDGYDNEKYYTSLLRETANILGRGNKIKLKDKFNILPIFICPQIKTSYRHILNLNLTNISIDDEYLELIETYRHALSCLTFDLVIHYQDIFMKKYPESMKNHIDYKKYRVLLDLISTNTHRLRTKYRSFAQLNEDDVTNISYINFFFSSIIDILKRKVRISHEMDLMNRLDLGKATPRELLDKVVDEVTHSLFDFFSSYSSPPASATKMEVIGADDVNKKSIKKKGIDLARNIAKYYQSYGVGIEILPEAEYKDGRYAFAARLLPGTDEKEIQRHSDNVRRLLDIEFLAPIITHSSIQFIASDKPLKEFGLLRMLESDQFRESKLDIPYAIGYDMLGDMVIADIDRFPHLIIGGASGFGKSSAIHSLLMSIVYKQPSDKVKLLLMDFGGSRLNMFQNTPHNILPGRTIRDVSEGKKYILKLRKEVERRIEILDSVDARAYDNVLRKWPSIICVIDEFPTFIRDQHNVKGEEKLEDILTGLLERARKMGVHFVLAAQDATQGNIKIKNTNLCAGIAFHCQSWHISKAVIGEPDAVKLGGVGSMYLRCYLQDEINRLQGAYMEPTVIMDMLDSMTFMSSNRYSDVDLSLDSSPISDTDSTNSSVSDAEDADELLLLEIVKLAIAEDTISNNMIKQKFEMGYVNANKFLKQLEEEGIINELQRGTKKSREVNLQAAEAYIQEHEHAENSSSSDEKSASISPHDSDVIPPLVEGNAEKQVESEPVTCIGSVEVENLSYQNSFESEHVEKSDLKGTSSVANEVPLDEMLPRAIVFALSQSKISNYRLRIHLHIFTEKDRAQCMLNLMEKWGIVSKTEDPDSMLVVPNSVNELSKEAMEYLQSHNYTKNRLKAIIKNRKS